MTGTGHDQQQWRGVDEGWGRRAVDFATLTEPANCREYVALHQHLGVGGGDRLLDVACGAGLAIELAAARGATCAGIDASARLVAVARDRVPDADVRVGRHARDALGRRQRSTWSPASAASGAPRRTRSPRSTGCCVPAAGSA